MADDIQGLKDKFLHLQNEIIGLESSKYVWRKELNTFHKDIEIAKDELSDAKKAFKMKFEELSGICTQIRQVEYYVEQFKNGQSYQEIEQTATDKVSELLANKKKLLDYVLVSLIEALRNDPDRYLLIDRMPLITTILNYDSVAPKQSAYPQGDERFVRERVLELADRILDTFQKDTVENTISTAAGLVGLEEASTFFTNYPHLP
jgi:hypothetical protein